MARYEAVVVGGGIGGLTVAAILAARGVSVCLVERSSQVGGCLAPFEGFGYIFDPGAGLYAEWGADGIHRRVFAELPVPPPEARRLTPAYVLRLPDGTDVRVGLGEGELFGELRRAFPECAEAARRFYRETAPLAEALHDAARLTPGLPAANGLRRLILAARHSRVAPKILARMSHTAGRHLAATSERFRAFIDAQLRLYALEPSTTCAYLYAAVALAQPERGLYGLRGGGPALALTLAEAVGRSGGTVRLNATALRLIFDTRGRAGGVELLSGERVEASRAVISNLTVWDTYGKLVGLARTPARVRASMKRWQAPGAYQVFIGGADDAVRRLPCDNVLVVEGSAGGGGVTDGAQFMLSAAPSWDPRAPAGARSVTVSTFTEAGRWFEFDPGDEGCEELDLRAMESLWRRLHNALPELGAGAEVIETATPRTLYERTRRRLGMAGGLGQALDVFGPRAPSHRTAVPGLYMTGDTVFPGNGVAAVTHSALAVADEIAPRGRWGRRRGD